MNKSALRNFATQARTELRDKIKIKALQLGITEENIEKETVQSSDAAFIDGRQLTIDEKLQRDMLIEEINIKGYNQVIEEVAYTWFNRFTALRFMEVNNYLPTKVRVLSSEIQGSYEPDIIKEALNIDLDVDKDLVYRLKTSNENDAIDRIYKYLIIKQCNALNDILPLMFEKIMNYTELLFPDGLLADGSFLRVMTDSENIPETNWEDVEVLGWLYQYYISERKDEVFAGLRKRKKIERNDIAPATQLFTPHWIVRYMVENSVGKLWQEGHPNEELKGNWKYYIEEAEQEVEVQKELDKLKEEAKKLKVEDIKIIDPAMGSGHILVYAFDLLYDIYISEGYIGHQIPKLIIEKNLYGIDIDERAFQLAYFALMMKGRAKSRRFFNEKIEVNICAIEESNILLKNEDFKIDDQFWEYLLRTCEGEKREGLKENFKYILDIFNDAKEYGSIIKVEKINFDVIEKRLEEIRNEAPKDMFETKYRNRILEIIPSLVKQGKIMSDKYDALITNPPYMGSRGMNPKLSEFVRKEYPNTKGDLFAVFMELDGKMVKPKGYMAMINQHSWMFLSSFENYRDNMLGNRTINSMLHLGPRAFEEIGGEVVQSTTFVNRKLKLSRYKGEYIRLVDYKSADLKEEKMIESVNNPKVDYRFTSMTDNFEEIPGSPIAYDASENVIRLHSIDEKIEKIAEPRSGITTSDNNRFLRLWFEVEFITIGLYSKSIEIAMESRKKWFPLDKAGGGKKWYGLNEYLINYENDGKEIKEYAAHLYRSYTRTIKNIPYYFKEHIGWSALASTGMSARKYLKGSIFGSGSNASFPNVENFNFILGLYNTILFESLFRSINPTLNLNAGDISKMPLVFSEKHKWRIDKLVEQNIQISKIDWDSFETSWDFKTHPFLKHLDLGEGQRLSAIFKIWQTETEEAFNQLKYNEEELNRNFIDIYGLEDELTPEVEDKDITITKVVEEKSEEDKKNSYTIDRQQAMESFLSYAVGCMLGRYSLDEEGLAYAGGEFDHSKYKIFPADKDNIIPILSDSYFEDDIVSKFEEFMKITFGEDSLNENLKYIAESLGVRKDESPRETIRRYFLNDFYKDHVRTYKKRPIYWLFTSGKEKAFNALIYMHRYDRSTLARIRTDYIHVLQSRFDVERANLKDNIAEEDNTAQKKRYEKQLRDLEKKIIELQKYDEKLHTMADKMIEIDLDDGVKDNYEKFKGLVAKI